VHNYGDPLKKFDPSQLAFRGHLRSLELSPINRPPMTCYYRFILWTYLVPF